MKEFIAIKKWDDEYNGAGIYSLVDENGKRYIGKAKHIQTRLHTHRNNLNRCAKGMEPYGIENENMMNHVKAGGVFHVEILHKIPWYKATHNEISRCEVYYCEKYGYKNIYNSAPATSPNWHYAPLNEITVILDCEEDINEYLQGKNDIQEYIKTLIRADISKA